jgi:putative transposase
MAANNEERRRKPIRLAPELYREGHVFSLTVTTYERFAWFGRYPQLAKAVQGTIVQTAVERGSELFAWCIMPDHVHLLIQDADVVAFVRLVKGRSVPVARPLAPSRRLWQRSFFDHALRREESTEHVARYILNNPVRAGLVEHAVDYPWSGSLVWPQWREHDWLTIGDVA